MDRIEIEKIVRITIEYLKNINLKIDIMIISVLRFFC